MTLFGIPRVWLKVIQDRVKGELALTHRHQESFDSGIVSLVERVTGQGQPELILDLPPGDLLVATEHVSLGTVREAELMNIGHATIGDETYHSVLGDEVD